MNAKINRLRIYAVLVLFLSAIGLPLSACAQIVIVSTRTVSRAILPIRCGHFNAPLMKDSAEMAELWRELVFSDLEQIANRYQQKVNRPPIQFSKLTFKPEPLSVTFDWAGLGREDATNVLKFVEAYLCLRAIGHSKEFAKDSMLERVSETNAVITDRFLDLLKQRVPDLPLKYVETDPLYTPRPTGPVFKRFVVFDGTFAWVYFVPFSGARITTTMYDRKLYSEQHLPKLRDAMQKVETIGKVEGREGKVGYQGWFFRKLDSVLTTEYGIEHIPCYDLNQHIFP